MQKVSKRIGAVALAACLLVTLAFGALSAMAAGDFPEDGTNTLTVNVADNSEAFVEDIATADVVADVYKLADAAQDATYVTYNYTLAAPFDALEGYDSAKLASLKSADWDDLAIKAAALVTADTPKAGTVAADGASQLSLPEDALYLVMPHGSSITPAYGDDVVSTLAAYSATYGYTFKPSITAAPTKIADANGVIGTAAGYGEWTRAIAITLKPEQQPLYGDLKIVKNVRNFVGEPATFVFHIVGTTPAGTDYDNYAAITFTSGNQAETLVKHIPAGTTVTVTEEYSGARYKLVDSDGTDKLIVSTLEVEGGADIATATFTNEPDGSGKGGHGIENNFTATEKGDWEWIPTPGDNAAARE